MRRTRTSGVAGCVLVLVVAGLGCGGGGGSSGNGDGGKSDGGHAEAGESPDGDDTQIQPPIDMATPVSDDDAAAVDPPQADAALGSGGFAVTPTTGLTTTEHGGQGMFTVALTAAPTSKVVVLLASDTETEGTASPAMLTFTTDNWNAPQTVTITGVDDQVADGDVMYKIVLSPAKSPDKRYEGVDPPDVSVTNSDDESPGLTVTGTALTTTEIGGQATFTVALKSKPTAMVTVAVLSEDLTEGIASPAMLTFTTDNWNAPQTVTVTGVDDMEADGNTAYKVKVGPLTGDDAKYTALMPVEVSLTNTDNETAGITLTPPTNAVTTEAGGTTTFQIVLNTKPMASVVINLTSSDTSEGTVAPASLTFTVDNWNAPQTVTVTGVDDALADGNQTYSILTSSTFSGDSHYQDLVVPDVMLSNTDNDSAGITVTAPMSPTTSEAGRQVTFTVALNSQPSADVVIPVSSSDTTEGTVSVAMLTFTSANWNARQPVTVTGVDDDLADGSQPYSVVLGAATSTDAKYMGIDPTDVSVTNTDNDSPGITLISDPFLTTTEAGGTATFTVVLNSQPTGNVVIPLMSNDTTEGTVAPASLTFTAANWSTAQTVTVTGVDDASADGNQVYSIVTAAAQSADNAYLAIDPPNVLVFNSDNDTAGVTVTAGSTLTTTEAGGTATFTVVLNSQPAANVTIPLTSSAPGEGAPSPSSLVFTSSNWATAQTVTVTGVNDFVADGPQTYSILTGFVLSADGSYNGINPADVALNNTDDDTVGITLTAGSGLTTTEVGGTAMFTVVLNSQPTANVTIPLTSTDTTEGTVPASVVFTPMNWNVAQAVVITGVNDDLDDGNQMYSITTAAATSTDTAYAGLNPADVTVNNTDDDTSGITVTAAMGLSVTEAAGMANTATFTVVLTTQPTANVLIGLTSSDTTEGTVSPSSLTFTSSNWATAQTVTITGVNDVNADGDIAYSIVTAAATSTDATYSGLNAADVAVTTIDDDAAGITVTAAMGLSVSEAAGAGNTATFTVVLTTQPTANVTIPLSSSDTTEGTVAPSSLTFTTSNWNTAQTVTITGVDDAIDDGTVAYAIVTGAATSTDASYSGRNAADVAVTTTDNDAVAITVTAASGLTVTEAAGVGNQTTFTVVLNSEPIANVVIGLTSSDTTQGTVSPASLTFTNLNWNVAQTVTVTGVDDAVRDGNAAFSIVTAAAVSTDTLYSGVNAPDVSITSVDNDTAGITVTPTLGLTVTEAAGAGHTATFTVVLTSQPTASVAVGLTSTNTAQGTVSPSSLTFTTGNWNVAQTVTVTGVDELIDDGDVVFNIVTAPAATADSTYNNMNASDVSVTNIDDDGTGFTVTPTSGLTVTEAAGAGHTATFTVVMTSQPTAGVTMGVSSSDTNQGTVSPSSLTFTTGNWNVAQTVTVTGADELIDDGDTVFTIVTAAASSTDTTYNNLNASDVSVTSLDNDSAAFTVTPTTGLTVTEAAGAGHTATFTVVMTSQPTASVTMGVTSSDINQGTVSPSSLTFTTGNWNVAQTVTVTGVDELIDDGDTAFTIVTAAASTADTSYNNLNASDVSVTSLDNDTAAITVMPTSGLTVTEAAGIGHTATFTVVLATQPTADVVIPLSSSDLGEGTISPGALTFTSVNWNVAQTVTITGVDDVLMDGDILFSIVTAPALGPGSTYAGLNASDVSVTNIDND